MDGQCGKLVTVTGHQFTTLTVDICGREALRCAGLSAAAETRLFHDGCHLEKSKNGHNSATVWPIGTKFGMLAHIDHANRTGSYNVELFKKR